MREVSGHTETKKIKNLNSKHLTKTRKLKFDPYLLSICYSSLRAGGTELLANSKTTYLLSGLVVDEFFGLAGLDFVPLYVVCVGLMKKLYIIG